MGLSENEVTAASKNGRPPGSKPSAGGRPSVRGKFIFVGNEKFYIKGVTYGAFAPREDGSEFHDLEKIERDFVAMAAHGINAVRIPHTVPPGSLLDAAYRQGLRVIVGLSAEQYVGYIAGREKEASQIQLSVRKSVRACAGHPALLCYVLGNEIPVQFVRYIGRSRVERYLWQLYHAVKLEDPEAIVTYANYPTTEYLQLPWLDLVCFNVYLETERALARYIAHLQNIAGDRPLLMGEIGLDSFRNGEEEQARSLRWQIRTAFTGGCAGAVVFAWTDEWFRSGSDTATWRFGLTDWDRKPKAALAAVRDAFAEQLFSTLDEAKWPRISVIVCTHNGSGTILDCLGGLQRLDYPAIEVIIIDDGSTDDTAKIARQFPFHVISISHLGLSNARNIGLQNATGEIVAYIDDDAWPDPHWLTYLALTFRDEACAGAGGPNIRPPGENTVSDCAADSPGGPIHVMLTDVEAEHLPGCNMAFRKEALAAVGGFDPVFRTAGDDVDLCWRMQSAGLKLVFSPAAVVWHRAPQSVAAYWNQQFGYGKAETILERKWPDKYNFAGHPVWTGRVYGRGAIPWLPFGMKIYSGIRGRAPFQFIYPSDVGRFGSLFAMPEWHLLVAGLAMLSIVGIVWQALRIAAPLLVLAVSLSLAHAGLNAYAAITGSKSGMFWNFPRWMLTALLHLFQPIARLSGRIIAGLHPWRRKQARGSKFPFPGNYSALCTDWHEAEDALQRFEYALRAEVSSVVVADSFAAWDLEVRGGIFGGKQIIMAIEDIGLDQQLIRVRWWPVFPLQVVLFVSLCAVLALAAAIDHAAVASVLLAFLALAVLLRAGWEAGTIGVLIEELLTRTVRAPPP
jgi:O-antigen biosynthesis protein